LYHWSRPAPGRQSICAWHTVPAAGC
jgi:hypothetical protein